jgi:uncharacterized protein YgfB (UPF0149 family)
VSRIGALCDQTSTELFDSELRFALFLPDDSDSLATRAQHFGEWCQAFLFGLGLAGLKNISDLSEEVQEALADINQFSQLDADAIEENDEAEGEFAELVEYTRMAALLLHTELAPTEPASNEDITH